LRKQKRNQVLHSKRVNYDSHFYQGYPLQDFPTNLNLD